MPSVKPIKPQTSPLHLPMGWLLVGIIAIATAGLWYNASLMKQPQNPVLTESSSWQKVTDRQAFFSSEIFMDRDKTYVYIPYKFDGNPQELWLNFDSSPSGQPNDYLITHPLLIGLTWKSINKGVVRLYQKNPTYRTIDQFINNPPDASKILIDNSVAKTEGYTNLNATILGDQTSLENYEYVLTSYPPSIKKGDAYEYSITLDASQAVLHNNAIQWMLFAPNATTSNPYSIGNIHIDYNRQ